MVEGTQTKQTVGGVGGHLLRRSVHLLIVIVPIIYYRYGEAIAGFFHLTLAQFLVAIILLNIVVEGARLKFRWTFWGHRHREARQISSFSWGVLSVCLVLLFAPAKQFAIPIIWSCALGDPLLGELRQIRLPSTWVAIVGILFVMLIWWLCTWLFATPWRLALLMGPLVVGLEWPNFKWIDDNALMQLVPLLIILLLYG